MKKLNVVATIKKKHWTILKFLVVLFILLVWVLVGHPKIDFYIGNFHFRFPPDIWSVDAAAGVQHEFAWGLDSSTSNVMKTRPGAGEDIPISIKAGSVRGSGTDPVLRIQIVNTGMFVIGEAVGLVVTDCTGVALKTCAGRTLGTSTSTSWVSIDKQNSTAGTLFRFRESDSATFIGGNQIPSVVVVKDHNPTPGMMVEGSTTAASSTSSFNSGSYPSSDYSFEYYGAAPTVQKTYMFAQTYNGVLSSFSGMHGSIGAVLNVLPANWNGSLIQMTGGTITGSTTATATIYFADDTNGNSTSSMSYGLWEEGTFITPAGCSSIAEGAGHEDVLDQDGVLVHKRSCNITGLTANTIYFFKITQTDVDGIAGDAVTLIGPFITNVASGTVHMHVNAMDANDLTAESSDELAEAEIALGTLPVSATTSADGELTMIRTTGRMQTESFNIISDFASNFTINSFQLRYVWGMRNVPEVAQNLYISAPGTEPALCAANGSGGTNWNLVETLPNASAGYIAERASSTMTGYTAPQLATADVCLSNTNNSGGAATDVVAFDSMAIMPIYTPPSSGNGSPTTTNYAATFVSTTGAQLNAKMNTQGITGKAYFEYGTTTAYGAYAPSATATSGEYVFNSLTNHVIAERDYFLRITGLDASTTYHYRPCLRSPPSAAAACGGDLTFDTPRPSVSSGMKNIIMFFE